MSIKSKIHINTHYTRSINLERDSNSLDAVNAYIPTSRALKLFSRVAEGFGTNQSPRAWSLIGPYGSGKSANAAFLSHLLSSPDAETTTAAIRKLQSFNKAIAGTYAKEVKSSKGYLKVLITGSPEPMSNKIAKALYESASTFFGELRGPNPKIVSKLKTLSQKKVVSTTEIVTSVQELQAILTDKRCRGIYIAIDELGKFLEFEARHYGANDIFILQSLAELACKGHKCNIFMFVLLHQSIEQYARGLGESAKNEWTKVQGRFEETPFLESAEQVLRVVSAAFEYGFSKIENREIGSYIKSIVSVLETNDSLPGTMNLSSAETLLRNCYPFHPLSALILPVLCQKVAQNERTLFSYLGSHEEFGLHDLLEKMDSIFDTVHPHHLYDYFITNKPAALGNYQTHRRWTEVVTAVERLGDAPADQIELLKAIGLLNIIGAKGGFKASKAILSTCSKDKATFARALKALTEKSIITYRKFSGEYRVWQGSDFNLEEVLEEEISKIGNLSLANELNTSRFVMPIVARRYTIESGTLRYFTPLFADAETVKSSPPSSNEPRIIFFLASTQDDKKIFERDIIHHFSDSDVVALCPNGTQLWEATVEVIALRNVQNTRQELNSDPVAKREFEDRLMAAEHNQSQLLQQLQEHPQNCEWYCGGQQLEVKNKRSFQERLSNVLESVYSRAPILHNELVNRDYPSGQANAARNRLLEAMMQCPGKVDLGIDKFPPEKSIYRSVLRETGLHHKSDLEFKEPSKRSTFYHAWKEINSFLDTTEKEPKSFAELNSRLMAPPYGIKAGILPILYIAVYIVYKHELAMYEGRKYRPVMTQEMLERFVKRPDEYTFQRFRITGLRSSIYNEYCKIIDTGTKQTVVQLVSPLAKFIGDLPIYTQKTRSSELPKKAQLVRDAFDLAKSPETLIFEDIPKALGYKKELGKKKPNLEGLALSLQGSLQDLNNAYPNMVKQQIRMLLDAFHMDTEYNLSELRKRSIGRYAGLEKHTVDVDGLKAFIKRLTKQEGSDEDWLENLLMFLGKKPTKKWTDTDRGEADVRLSDFAKRILDLEALRIHYDRSKQDMDGEFDVILLRSLKKGNNPVDEVVAIDNKRKDAIKKCKKGLWSALKEHSDGELQLAALAEVVDEFLIARRKPKKKASKSSYKSNSKLLKEVENG